MLIHALKQSIAPIEQAFDVLWPEAERSNLLDDALSVDRARGASDESLLLRFLDLTKYAVLRQPAGILFTCSAFGPMIEACARAHPSLPILKPNEAMIEDVGRSARSIALLATFAPSLDTMPDEFASLAPGVIVTPIYIERALAALKAGRHAEHDALAAQAAAALRGIDAIALAQFSLARAAPAIRAATGLPVFTTPDSAVLKLKRLVAVV